MCWAFPVIDNCSLLGKVAAFAGGQGAAAFAMGSHFGFALALVFAAVALVTAPRIKAR